MHKAEHALLHFSAASFRTSPASSQRNKLDKIRTKKKWRIYSVKASVWRGCSYSICLMRLSYVAYTFTLFTVSLPSINTSVCTAHWLLRSIHFITLSRALNLSLDSSHIGIIWLRLGRVVLPEFWRVAMALHTENAQPNLQYSLTELPWVKAHASKWNL